MDKIGNAVLGISILIICTYGMIKGVKIFDCFVKGAAEGIKSAFKLAPTLMGLIVAVNMANASGGFDLTARLCAPLCKALGFPQEVMPLAMVRPFSGAGATAIFEDIISRCGPDSFQGQVASVLMGSTETTFYATAVYFSSVNVTKTRHTVPCALIADTCSFVLSVVAVNIFM